MICTNPWFRHPNKKRHFAGCLRFLEKGIVAVVSEVPYHSCSPALALSTNVLSSPARVAIHIRRPAPAAGFPALSFPTLGDWPHEGYRASPWWIKAVIWMRSTVYKMAGHSLRLNLWVLLPALNSVLYPNCMIYTVLPHVLQSKSKLSRLRPEPQPGVSPCIPIADTLHSSKIITCTASH